MNPKIFGSKKGGLNMVDMLVTVLFAASLLPIIAVQVAGTTNLSTTEQTIWALSTLFVVLGVVYGIARASGIVRK